ncbi:uncharacterized protein FOMMEDRAFT_170314, partial [Fomitiporia mediterranea MF3/22]|uniref:uncharacterized protein n=1 Tax=Fomitiporia mediterranea (strain MF3/22) TaxID=694068 RepID=UPI0004407A83
SDSTIRAPLRINVSAAAPASDRQARKNIEAFLLNYQSRPGGADSAILTRLEKLSASLRADKEGRTETNGSL